MKQVTPDCKVAPHGATTMCSLYKWSVLYMNVLCSSLNRPVVLDFVEAVSEVWIPHPQTSQHSHSSTLGLPV